MNLTNDLLKELYPYSDTGSRLNFVQPLNQAMEMYGINTRYRIVAFLAQIGHESSHLNHTTENLNYSAKALRMVFGSHFQTNEIAVEYARNPEMIANHVYANRLGNGNEASGDGWKYRGRGLIQLTGKENYKAVSAALKEDFLTHPEKLSEPLYASLSAAWFWVWKGLNELSDHLAYYNEEEIFKRITKRINGGLNGLGDRLSLYRHAKQLIS